MIAKMGFSDVPSGHRHLTQVTLGFESAYRSATRESSATREDFCL